MQTINDKWKYKLQQLFKMLSLINDGQFAVSRDLNRSLLQFSRVACCVLLHGAVVAIETAQLTLNLYQAFQTQSICN